MTRRASHAASLSLLSALLLAYAIILFFDDDDTPQRRFLDSSSGRRFLRADKSGGEEDDARVLAKNGDSPLTMEVVPGEYIVKPWVGYAQADVWESYSQTRLLLAAAQSSSNLGEAHIPRFAIEPHPNRWASSIANPETPEWLQIDMGGPHDIEEVYIQWEDAYAAAYTIQVGPERPNCRSDGTSCADYWVTVADVSGKTDSSPTMDTFDDETSPQGVRYMRILLNQRAPGEPNFSIFEVRVYRKKMAVGGEPTGMYCGGTTAAVASTLLTTHGGTLIQLYEDAEFFAASMTEAQKASMFDDACAFTVEPNYVITARGRTARRNPPGGGDSAVSHVDRDHRRLAIPEFNLRDEQPLNWGLERIGSHGKRNGKYIWFHEGYGTHIYMFDTGIKPDHTDFNMRNGTSRLRPSNICTGLSTDYEFTDHGTHAASVAAGFWFGTAKSASIHPMQVLDKDGRGTTASFLCGVDKLMQDGKAYAAAHSPKKYKAVINLSFGVNGHSDALDKAVQDMAKMGYIVSIAAGDNNGNACFYSPYDPAAITVGAVRDHRDGTNEKTVTSNYGGCVDVFAPGENINGASNAGEYEGTSMNGTSVAAAFASGAAALFLEEANTYDRPPEEVAAFVKELLVNKAENHILVGLGHMSPNKMLQTTVTKCKANSECAVGLTCLYDGTCRDLSKPLK